MSSELKPCPFCGEQPYVLKTFPGFVVKCWNCKNAMTVGTTPRTTRQHAINVWNQRAKRTCEGCVYEYTTSYDVEPCFNCERLYLDLYTAKEME